MPLTRPELRALLDKLLVGANDFDAFVLDHFPDVYHRFTNGMERTQKTTLLLTYVDPTALADALQPSSGKDSELKILFLAANPTSTDQLSLGRELRKIEDRIGAGTSRPAFQLRALWAVRPSDLQRALLQEKPDILHFSGHGSPREQLILEDDTSAPARVEKDAFVNLIGILRANLRLVVLNACDTEPIAEALVRHVDCAIGMHESIGDESSVAFAASFYQALGFGQPVDVAFKLGCNELELRRIPESQIPRVFVKKGVDVTKLVLSGKRS